MGLVVDPTTGAVVDDGIPADDGMLPMPAPVPVAQPAAPVQQPMDQAAMQNVIAGFEAQQAQAAPLPPSPLDEQAQQFAQNGQTPEEMAAIAAQAKAADTALSGGAASIATSDRGYDAGKAVEVSKDPAVRALQAASDDARKAAADREAAELAESDAILDLNAKAIEAQRKADEDERRLQMSIDVDNQIKRINAQHDHEQRMLAIQARADAAKQRYEADVATARSMVADPYANLRGAPGAMAMLAMAGHTWLANMGPGAPVLPDIQGMIDNIIQTTMQSQASNTANAWKVAESSDNIWNLARQGADDEIEAHERYRGFLEDAYLTASRINALKFAGPKAQAAADALLSEQIQAASGRASKIRATKAETDMAIYQTEAEMAKAQLEAATRVQTARINVGPEYARIKAQREKDAADRAAKAGEAPPLNLGTPIMDESGNRTGKVLNFRNKDVTPATKAAAEQAAIMQPQVTAAATELATAWKDLNGAYTGKWGRLTATDTKLLRFHQAGAALQNILQKWANTGATLTDAEVEKVQTMMGAFHGDAQSIADKIKGTPDYGRTIANGAIQATDQLEKAIAPYRENERPEETAYFDKYMTAGPTSKTAAALMGALRDAPAPTPDETEKAAKISYGRGANKKRDAGDYMPQPNGAFYKIAEGNENADDTFLRDSGPWDGNPVGARNGSRAWGALVRHLSETGRSGYLAKREVNGALSLDPTGVSSTGVIDEQAPPAFVAEQFALYKAAYGGNKKALAQLEDIESGTYEGSTAFKAEAEPRATAKWFLDHLRKSRK